MTLVPFFVVLFLSIIVSFFASKKEGDYFLAGRSVGWFPLFGTLLGTQVGVGFVLGGTDAVWSQGIFGCFYGLGLAFGMIILGLGYSKRLRSFNAVTLPDLLGKRYNSSGFKRFASTLSILSISGILIAQAVGLKKFLLSLGFSNDALFLLSWGSVVLYTTFGGLLAVIWTDVIQSLAIVVILCIAFFGSLLPRLPEISAHAMTMNVQWGTQSFSMLLMPIFYIFVAEHMAQRCFAAKTPKSASLAAIATGCILIMLSIIPYTCGVLGHSMGLSSANGSIFMQVMKSITSPVIFTLAASAVLLAIISTTSSLLLAISSNVTQDTSLRVETGRLITLLVGLIATLGCLMKDDIISWIVSGYEVSVGALLVPLLVGVFSRKESLSKEAAWAAAACGIIGVGVSHLFFSGLLYTLAPIVFSGIGFSLGLVYSVCIEKHSFEKQSIATQPAIE